MGREHQFGVHRTPATSVVLGKSANSAVRGSTVRVEHDQDDEPNHDDRSNQDADHSVARGGSLDGQQVKSVRAGAQIRNAQVVPVAASLWEPRGGAREHEGADRDDDDCEGGWKDGRTNEQHVISLP